MVIFYKKWKKYNEIQLTKNKMDLNIRKMTNHPPSPDEISKGSIKPVDSHVTSVKLKTEGTLTTVSFAATYMNTKNYQCMTLFTLKMMR